MLSVRPKINELTFRVFSRSLHPELLETHASRVIQRESYNLHLAITSAGHSYRFEHGKLMVVEVATSSHHLLPRQCELLKQRVRTQPFERQLVVADQIGYQCWVNLETVDPKHLFGFNQIIDQADREHSLVYRFGSNGRIAMGAMSLLKVESRSRSVRIHSIHTFPDTSQVLTSQTVFDLPRHDSGNQ